jgi:hypothetical protein
VRLRDSLLVSLLSILTVASAPRLLRAQDPDIIRGRVIGPDSQPVPGATVTATSLANQTARTARTGKDGRYSIIFANGGGDYMMSFVSLGMQPLRFEVKREADEAVLVADAKMARTAVVLDAMRVEAQRLRPGRNDLSPDIGGSERYVNNSNIPADMVGDLAAMAASIPGVTLIPSADGGPNGFSVLGLGVDQNSTTLNGLSFSGGDIPRDGFAMTRLSTTAYDVSRGGFSGGQLSLNTFGGSNFIQRSLHITYDQPHLQWTDRAGSQLGQQFTNVQASGSAGGPIVADKAFYNASFQFGRRSSDLQTLLNTDAFTLQRIGVSGDSVTRLMLLLQNAGIPTLTQAIPNDKQTENGSFLTRFDLAPSGSHAVNFTVNGRWNQSQASMLSTTAVPAHGGEIKNYGGTIQADHSSYFGFGIFDDTRMAVSTSRSTGDPYLNLPDARVRVNSTFDDGTAGVSTLAFGGNAGLPRNSTNSSWQLVNQTSWFTGDNKHRFRVTEDVRLDRYNQDQTFNRLGTFNYNSLADFEAGLPSSFTRRLAPRWRSGDELITAFSLGDAWRKTSRLQIQYGVRVDANRFGSSPHYNAAVDSIFGLRNDRVPNDINVAPRVGFSWGYGQAPQILGFEGASQSPRGRFSGGIGEFVNVPGAGLIGSAIDNTGLPDAAQQLVCAGSAVPIPAWAAYAADPGTIPTACADGTTGSVFASNLPNVMLFDPGYRAQRSWRSNLQWSAPVLSNRFRAQIEGTYSLNLDQPGMIDRNFDDAVRFRLADEGNRPVFVSPTSIVPFTGAIASRDARVTQSFAQVNVQRSDLRSVSRQISASLSPNGFSTSLSWNASYVYQNVRDIVRGFGGNTSGDPLITQWGRSSADARHQFNFSLSYTLKNAVGFSVFGRVASGTPYTPIVAGDINGDGASNDRAFIFDPAHTADTALAAAMRNLLGSAPGSVRRCLLSQIGQIAGRNSCEGPWTASQFGARIGFVSQKIGLPPRTTVTLNFSNPLTGLDALVHGSDNLRGWGQTPFADPTLLYVRGFDPSTQRFRYDVNPRFGDTRASRNGIRAPFQMELDVRMNVGPEPQRQQLRLMLWPGRGGKGTKLTEQQIRQRYTRGPNPFETILRQRDSLHLTQEQTDSIASFQKQYQTALDTIWNPVAKYLAGLGDTYDLESAYSRLRDAQNAQYDVLMKLGPKTKSVLTAEQTRKLPPFIAGFLDPRALQAMKPGNSFGPGSFSFFF